MKTNQFKVHYGFEIELYFRWGKSLELRETL